MDWILAIMIAAVGAALAVRRSTWAVDYLIWVFVLNRGLRRVLDWHAGEFNPFSPISLTPLFIACVMMFPFLAKFKVLPRSYTNIFLCLFAAITYAFVLGFLRVRIAAVYVLAEFLAPMALFGYALVMTPPSKVRDRWIRCMAWSAVVASIYGWYQYMVIPPWDAFWVRAVGFEGYLGVLQSKQMSVFSTMHERGVLAGFLGLVVVAMVVSPRWRTFGSWISVGLVLSCIFLTLSRGGFLFAAIGIVSYICVNRGASLGHILAGLLFMAVVGQFGLGSMPGSERIQERFKSLGHMESDGSLKARLEIYKGSMNVVLTHPLGYGFGASGYASRINSGGVKSGGEDEEVVGDAGYSEFFLTFGWFGAGFFIAGMVGIWRAMAKRFRAGERDPSLLLGRALMIGVIPMFTVGNVLSGISLFWLSFGVALAPNSSRVVRRRSYEWIPQTVSTSTEGQEMSDAETTSEIARANQ